MALPIRSKPVSVVAAILSSSETMLMTASNVVSFLSINFLIFYEPLTIAFGRLKLNPKKLDTTLTMLPAASLSSFMIVTIITRRTQAATHTIMNETK